MDNKGDRQSVLSCPSIFPMLIPKQITREDFQFEKEAVPCNTPTSSSRYHNAANGIKLKDSDEYIRDMGSILSLQPWIFKKENNFGLRYGKNKSSLRARRGQRNLIKPLSMENCLIPQLYDENFEFEEYVFGSVMTTPVTRPFVVTDGERVISKSGCKASLHIPAETRPLREVDCSRKKKGIVGVSPLQEMTKSKRRSVDFEELDISDNIMRSRLQSPSQANEFETFKILHGYASLMKYVDFNNLDSLFEVDSVYFWSCSPKLLGSSYSSTTFIFCIGVCVGVLSAIISNRNELEKINDKLRCTENLVQDLQEELEMKDALTVQELLPHENASRGLQEEESHSMSKIEAELEAELERLEINLTASRIEGRTSALDEVDQDLIGEIVQGELRVDALSQRDDDIIEARSDDAINSSSSPVDTDTCNYPVSPRQLSLRLHEVIQERLEQRIKELERALAQSNEQLQLLENERNNPSERTLSNSEMSSSSHQDSPTLVCQPGPFRLNLTGDALDAYGEACEEFMRISGEGEKEEFYEVDRSLIWGLEGKKGYDDCAHHDDDDDDDDVNCDDDDDEERFILEKILERTKQGSPVIRHAQMMLLSLDD